MSNKYVIIFFALSHVISNQSNIISIYKINTLKLQWLQYESILYDKISLRQLNLL